MAKKKKTEDALDPHIIKRSEYVDERGRLIIGQELVSGTAPADFAPFLGQGVIEANVKTEFGDMKGRVEVTFGLDVETIEEAYAILEERYEEVQAEEVENIRKQAQEKVAEIKAKQSGIIKPGDAGFGNGGQLPTQRRFKA